MKNILILHGWPQFKIRNHFLVKHLLSKKNNVYVPNLFKEDVNFTIDSLKRYVLNVVADNKIDAIIGISLGGLILPHIAVNYPNSKIIFISSGQRLDANSEHFNKYVEFINKTPRFLLEIVLKFPNSVLEFFYQRANPFNGEKSTYKDYLLDMKKNVRFIKQISIQKEIEIINLVSKIDNSKILRSLKNKALIISGKKDILMSQKLGRKLKDMIKNSKLILTDGSHFNSLNLKDLKYIDNFL